MSKVAPCLRQFWTLSKINTSPSLYAKLFEITQSEEQHWTTSIQKEAKETQSMAVSLLKVSNNTLETQLISDQNATFGTSN